MTEPPNVYKAPSQDRDDPARGPSATGRTFSLSITVLSFCLAASALVMRAEHWTAEITLGPAYVVAFWTHTLSAIMLVVGVVCSVAHLVALPEGISPRDSAAGTIGMMAWALATAGLVFGPFLVPLWPDAAQELRIIAFSSATLSTAATALHSAIAAMRSGAGPRAVAGYVLGLVVMTSVLGTLAADSALGNRTFSYRLTGWVMVAGLFAVAPAWRALRRHGDPAVRVLLRGGVYPGLALALAMRLIAGLIVHAGDTYLMLAAVHAAGSVTVITWLAAVLMRSAMDGASPPRRATRAAAGLLCAGAHATTLAIFLVGRRGMPRRYDRYLEAFEGSHRLMSVGVALSAVGAVLLLAAFVVARMGRAQPA